MIENLKNYNITQLQPGFYDVESGTVIQQTARLYQKMQECVDTLNNYLEEIQSTISTQDTDIEEAIDYMKNNIEETTNRIFNEYLEDEKIKANLKENYDETTEELTLSIIESEV